MSRTLLVVLSGGADSTICLYWAKQNAEIIHAITFDYGQRHAVEIKAAKKIAQMAGVASHEVITLPEGVLRGTSPLVSKNEKVGHYTSAADLPGGIEPTFVPARNALFFTLAANRACVLGCHGIVTGVCEEDYGGYPDCRAVFVERMSAALSLGIYGKVEAPNHPILAPLMHLSKCDSVLLAAQLPGCMDALAVSHTSYDGDYPPNPFNHASLLRARGFEQARIPDPLIMRAIAEKKLPADYPDSGLVEGSRYGNPETWADEIKSALEREASAKKEVEPASESEHE